MTTPEVIRLAHLMVMMSTTHLSISLLDGVSLDESSLVGTKLQPSPPPSFPYSLLGELVHLLLSVVASSLVHYAFYSCPLPSGYPSCASRREGVQQPQKSAHGRPSLSSWRATSITTHSLPHTLQEMCLVLFSSF